MQRSRLIKKLITAFFSILSITVILCSCSEKIVYPSEETDNRILHVIKKAQAKIVDIDNDGKINCVDYSLVFKLVWDFEYPNLSDRCQIVRNKSFRMNHLFIQVLNEDGTAVEVEPWASNPEYYLMVCNWTRIYNPKHNIYTESEYWLSCANRKKLKL